MPTPPHAVSPDLHAAKAASWRTAVLALMLYAALTALSVVWLEDWGRHGPAFARSYATQQRLTIAMAGFLGLVVWLIRDRLALLAVRAMARWSMQSRRRRWLHGLGLAALLVSAIGLLHWAHKLHGVPGLPPVFKPGLQRLSSVLIGTGALPIRPSLTVELLRLPACLLVAWALYRWQHAQLSLRSNLALAAAVLVMLVVGLWVTQDKGPMLVVAIAMVLLGAVALARLLPPALQSPGARGLLVGAGGAAGLALLLALLPMLTPADRLQAWRQPYASQLEYLAQITWFLQAAAKADFGPGRTPWCGYLGALLDHCRGLPVETQSDYTLAAIAGLWGPLAAWFITVATALWLLTLIRLAAVPRTPQHGVDAAGLAASTGALYALMLLAQLFVTALGNLGLLPLTGVPMPLLSWGRASLVGATLAMALVMPRHRATGRTARAPAAAPAALPAMWARVLRLAGAGCAVALACVALGLWQRLHDQAPATLASGRSNPWLPLAGCVRTAGGAPLGGVPSAPAMQQALCGGAAAERLAARVPDDAPLRLALASAANGTPLAQGQELDGLRIPQHGDITTTLDDTLQAKADLLARCMTGLPPGGNAPQGCGTLVPASLAARFARRAEGAAVRSLSLVTLRQSDGAIVATAHARSACSAAQMANTARPPGCLPEAQRAIARPGRLAQQALRADDMVASTIKPLLADAMLNMPGGAQWQHGTARQRLLAAIAASDTAFFIDELLCFGASGRPADCQGPATLSRRIAELRLADGIDITSPAAPGVQLAGLPMALPDWPPTGAAATRELAAASRCHALPANQRWRSCSGEQLAALVAPLWGQGNARSHPLAVAQLYHRLAAAARGQSSVQAPHLLPAGGTVLASGFQPQHAALILEGLQRVPLVGTGRAACTSVHGASGCKGMGLAMKTGTSLFPQHAWTAAERATRCRAVYDAQDLRRNAPHPLPADLARDAVHCALYPMKWGVLIEGPAPGRDALITVVLAERNRDATTGHLDAGDDRGPNVALEAALLLHAGRQAHGQAGGRTTAR